MIFDYLEIDVKSKFFSSDDVPGAAIPGVQLTLKKVTDRGVVPMKLLHGGYQNIHDLNLQCIYGIDFEF